MLIRADIERAIRAVASKYPLKTVVLFGSYAEGTASPNSDVDLLIEFRQPSISLLTLNQLKYDLEDQLGLAVDIIHAPLPESAMIEPGKTVMLLGA